VTTWRMQTILVAGRGSTSMNNPPLDVLPPGWVTWVMRSARFYAFAFAAYLVEGAGQRRLR